MPEQATRVTEMSLTLARVSFSKCVNQVCFGAERIVVTSYGEPKAAIVSVADLRRLQELDQARAEQVQQAPVSDSPGERTEP
jgi:prevent-host-death family protein